MSKANVKTVVAAVANPSTLSAVVAPSFDAYAPNLVKAYEAFDKASNKLSTTVDVTISQYLDACTVAGVGKTEKEIKSIGAAIRDSQIVVDMVALGAFEKTTFTEYAQSAMRAYFYDVPFEQGLKNNPAFILPWSGAKSNKAKTNGKVTTTTRVELDKTISKALEQARALGLLNFAAELVDLATESLDGFSE
jgi:hypothetical protein